MRRVNVAIARHTEWLLLEEEEAGVDQLEVLSQVVELVAVSLPDRLLGVIPVYSRSREPQACRSSRPRRRRWHGRRRSWPTPESIAPGKGREEHR